MVLRVFYDTVVKSPMREWLRVKDGEKRRVGQLTRERRVGRACRTSGCKIDLRLGQGGSGRW